MAQKKTARKKTAAKRKKLTSRRMPAKKKKAPKKKTARASQKAPARSKKKPARRPVRSPSRRLSRPDVATILRGGRIVTAEASYVADVRIEGETIAAIGKDLPTDGAVEIDCRGAWVIPGGIDPHVHMELPFMGTVSKDDPETGTRCAVAGGTTMLIDFAIPTKQDRLLPVLDAWDKKFSGRTYCDYTYHMAVTNWNEEIAEEIPRVVRERGINSFKVFLAYQGVFDLNDTQLFYVIRAVREAGGIVLVHQVNGNVIPPMAERFIAEGKGGPLYHALSQPPEAEGEGTNKVIRMSEINDGAVYIVHTTAKEALEEIAAGRRRGKALAVYGETCPQYLFLTQDLYELPNFEGAKYVLSPPLRTKEHTEAMWKALADHTIETIGTDHCSFDFKGQKDLHGKTPDGKPFDARKDFRFIPNGFNGIEERMTLLYTYGVREGRISENRWIELCSTNAAKIFGLHPKKGTIAVGSDADLVVWDCESRGIISAKNHQSAADYNVYEGFKTAGKAKMTFVRGRRVWNDGSLEAPLGHGRFVPRGPFRKLV